jgi:hypothetical protein
VPDEPATDYGRDETIPDDAVLVRGGPMTLVSLRVAESRPLKEGYDFHGLSMFSFPGCDVDEIARRVRNTLPQREICWATAGEIRAKGFGLRRTGSTPGHFSLVFDETPSDDDLRTVLRLYEGKCKDNPYKRARRRRSN